MNTATSSHQCTTTAGCVRHSIIMIQDLKCMTTWKISGTAEKTAMSLLSKQNYRVKFALGRVTVSTILFRQWKI